MEPITLILRFDNPEHTLSATNGLPLGELAKLCQKLSAAFPSTENRGLVLSEVFTGSYGALFTTEHKDSEAKFIQIHNCISKNDFGGLNSCEKAYCHCLMEIQSAGNYIVEASNGTKTWTLRIENSLPVTANLYYYEISGVYGTVTSIGGKTLDGKTFIILDNTSYSIEVDTEQEKKLLLCYKKKRLYLTLRKKINADTNEVKSAVLMNYEELADVSFFDTIHRIREEYPEGIFVQGDSVEVVRAFRDSNQL